MLIGHWKVSRNLSFEQGKILWNLSAVARKYCENFQSDTGKKIVKFPNMMWKIIRNLPIDHAKKSLNWSISHGRKLWILTIFRSKKFTKCIYRSRQNIMKLARRLVAGVDRRFKKKNYLENGEIAWSLPPWNSSLSTLK